MVAVMAHTLLNANLTNLFPVTCDSHLLPPLLTTISSLSSFSSCPPYYFLIRFARIFPPVTGDADALQFRRVDGRELGIASTDSLSSTFFFVPFLSPPFSFSTAAAAAVTSMGGRRVFIPTLRPPPHPPSPMAAAVNPAAATAVSNTERARLKRKSRVTLNLPCFPAPPAFPAALPLPPPAPSSSPSFSTVLVATMEGFVEEADEEKEWPPPVKEAWRRTLSSLAIRSSGPTCLLLREGGAQG